MAGGIDVSVSRELWGVNKWIDTESGVKLVFKAARDTIRWLDKFKVVDRTHDEPFKQIHDVSDSGKKSLNAIEAIPKAVTLAKECFSFVARPCLRTFGEVVGATTNLWSSIQEFLELIFIDMNPENALLLDQIGGSALSVGMSWLLFKDIEVVVNIWFTQLPAFWFTQLPALRAELAESEGEAAVTLQKYVNALEAKRTNAMIKVAQWTSLLVIGILTISSAVFAYPVAGVAFLLCSSISIVTSIASHFHSVHTYEPIFHAPSADEPRKGMMIPELREFFERFGDYVPKFAKKRLEDKAGEDAAAAAVQAQALQAAAAVAAG